VLNGKKFLRLGKSQKSSWSFSQVPFSSNKYMNNTGSSCAVSLHNPMPFNVADTNGEAEGVNIHSFMETIATQWFLLV